MPGTAPCCRPWCGTRNSGMDNMGGTEAGNAAARADAWPQTLAFFDAMLGGPR
ncbi:MAG: hypothetical protein WDN44_05640 [Sphingomonas sp.]